MRRSAPPISAYKTVDAASSSSVGTFLTNYEVSHPRPLLMSSTIPYMKTLTRIGTLKWKNRINF